MFINDIIVKLSNGIENNLNENILISFQEYLLKAGIFTMASNIIATLIFTIFLFLILSIFLSFILSFDLLILMIFSVFGPIILLIGIVLVKSEKRLSQVETSIPDFLRQLSSMLKVGLSLESALDDLSKNGKGPLYDELKRVVIEIKFGKSFEESLRSRKYEHDAPNFTPRISSLLDIEGGKLNYSLSILKNSIVRSIQYFEISFVSILLEQFSHIFQVQ